VAKLAEMVLSKGLSGKASEHREFARLTAMKRVERTSQHGRGDFMDSMLKHRGTKEGLSDDELAAHAYVLIFAGSETTATLLSGVTYWLLRTPNVLRRAVQEVRSAFERDEEITFASTSTKLPYMQACLTEGLRMYPPVPTNIPRMCLPEVTISVNGLTLPPGVSFASLCYYIAMAHC
jgi:cytochrome P450